MDEGWRADEAEVTRIGIQLLDILNYLGSRRPSVTHRCYNASTIFCVSAGLLLSRTAGTLFRVLQKLPVWHRVDSSCASTLFWSDSDRGPAGSLMSIEWPPLTQCKAPTRHLEKYREGAQESKTRSLTTQVRLCRDVKAENVVLEGGKVGGRVFLVDFGGVQAAAAGDALATGSTVIGTYGYMAPEQFRGAASPASDLYGLGGTLLFLLSGACR